GTYTATLVSAGGCDSVATLILNVSTVVTGTQTLTKCANQLPFTWNGQNITAAGTYTATLISAGGCDSLATLILNVTTVVTGTQTLTKCANQLPFTSNEQNITAAGTYTATLISAGGCDSVATLILNVSSVVTGTQTLTKCANQLPFT